MDQQDTINHEVIEELRQVRIAANELESRVKELVELTSSNSHLYQKYQELKSVTNIWEKVLSRFGCDIKE